MDDLAPRDGRCPNSFIHSPSVPPPIDRLRPPPPPSWAIFLPASYPAFGGWLSILTYAVSTGLPLLLIAEFGHKVRWRDVEAHAAN